MVLYSAPVNASWSLLVLNFIYYYLFLFGGGGGGGVRNKTITFGSKVAHENILWVDPIFELCIQDQDKIQDQDHISIKVTLVDTQINMPLLLNKKVSKEGRRSEWLIEWLLFYPYYELIFCTESVSKERAFKIRGLFFRYMHFFLSGMVYYLELKRYFNIIF